MRTEIDVGIVIDSNAEQLAKVELLTFLTPDGIVIDSNEPQSLNAEIPIFVTDVGISIVFNDKH